METGCTDKFREDLEEAARMESGPEKEDYLLAACMGLLNQIEEMADELALMGCGEVEEWEGMDYA